MMADEQYNEIALLWRLHDVKPQVLDCASKNGATAIFDLSSCDLNSAAASLVRADAGAHRTGVKISPESVLDGSALDFVHETGISSIWMELHPALMSQDPEVYLSKIEELSTVATCFPVCGDLGLISKILAAHPRICNLALKGSEASGFVSSETIFTLFTSVRKMSLVCDQPPRLSVWGAIATPEAAAAFLSAGARCVVFESVHWLTDLVDLGPATRDRVAALKPEHTELVGLSFGVPCRLFNRGNSVAAKELRKFAGSLCGGEIADDDRRSFAARVESKAVHPLESSFSRDELVPLGIEAAFAGAFVRRFGASAEEAIGRFLEKVRECLSWAREKLTAFTGGPVAEEFGTRFALIQGAMSWITDVPEFAREVARAGALPTLALGMMPEAILDEKLGRIREVLGDMPFAANVITLQENPHREQQLAWIKKIKPRFAVIAAGEPSHARDLLKEGVEVIYIAANAQLVEMAFDAGVRYVICEGHEAGGHVGEFSTVTLAQILLDRRDLDPVMFNGRRIILAGGICDRESAFMAAMLGADAIQVGTSYLATREIVETGALTELYQKMVLERGPGSTVVTGEGTGLRVRSLNTPRIEAICALERDFATGSGDEASFRKNIEQLTAGSLLVAARGLDGSAGAPLEEQTCMDRGQFMCGACGGILDRVRTVRELHFDLLEASLPEGLPSVGVTGGTRPWKLESDEESRQAHHGEARQRKVHRAQDRERIAITGMSVVNSLGRTPGEVWAASLAMKSGVVPVPSSRWNHELFYDPRPRAPEKTYCKVGAFQNIDVSRKEIGVPPQDFRTMTASTRITMWLAKQAIEDSGILTSGIPRERIAVLISQNSGEAAATLEDMIIRGAAGSIVDSVKSVLPLAGESERAVEEAIKSGRLAVDDTTLLGRLNCTAGGFICNQYGFMGPSFAVSAACATALVALFSAYQMIRNGVIDAAVIGGAEEPLTPMHFLEFSALGALAGLSGVERQPSQASRPFDAERDGMVLGEGGGMIVIERESVARAREARILGYITAMGASNNHLGMVESSSLTQEIAVRASFDDAQYGPEQVDLVECHATSTVQGDAEEVVALRRFFDSGRRSVLTSFKSQIGHTLGASGINSLIRGIMAMSAGVFPATLNFGKPDPSMNLADSGLRVLNQPEDWPAGDGRPRRFQVNAFGFGGSNYVVQLEESLESRGLVMMSQRDVRGRTVVDGKAEVLVPDGVHFFRSLVGGNQYRLGVVADTKEGALTLLETSAVSSTSFSPKQIRNLARQGVHAGLEGRRAPLAFVFPGQGSHYQGMGRDLYESYPLIREWLERAAAFADFDLLNLLFFDSEEDLQKTRWQQPALFSLEFALVQYLTAMGVRPVALAGHSLGELTALCLAGVYSFEDGFRIVNMRARCMDKACSMNVDPGVMMALDAPLELIENRLAECDGVYVTNINSPHQVVVGGDTEAVKAIGEEFKAQGYRRSLLRVSMAFHSPIMRCIHDELEEFIAGIEFHGPKIPVISNTTKKPFPSDPTEIKNIVMAHLESPVHWMENVRTLRESFHVNRFVEVGPRDILTNLILDTDSEAECIQTCLPGSESHSLRNATAQLYAAGCLPEGLPAEQIALTGKKAKDSFGSQQRGSKGPGQSVELIVPRAQIASDLVEHVAALVRKRLDGSFKAEVLDDLRKIYDPGVSAERLEAALSALFPGLPEQVPMSATTGSQAAGAQAISGPPDPAVTMREDGPATEDDITETVIRMIMDATGYERDEIEPGMDLREDLSIRSSRLPVIMDNLENRFAIKIRLEDFIEVRTVGDIAQKLRQLIAGNECASSEEQTIAPVTESASETPAEEDSGEREVPLKRIVFQDGLLEHIYRGPFHLSSEEPVLILSAGGTGISTRLSEAFQAECKAGTVPLRVGRKVNSPGDECLDMFTLDGAQSAAARMAEAGAAAGIVFILDEQTEDLLKTPFDVHDLLRGSFTAIKAFLKSPAKKFALVLHDGSRRNPNTTLLAEGLLGMFLTLSHEFPSVQFRSVRLEGEADPAEVVRWALDRSQPVIETVFRQGGLFSPKGSAAPASSGDSSPMEITREDVVVLSGGARGITFELARNLAVFGCRLVFLGRTSLEPELNYGELASVAQDDAATAIEKEIRLLDPGLSSDQVKVLVKKAENSLEIIRNVEELRSRGVEASYYRCDVADSEGSRAIMTQILNRYGRIDGIVHGAGVLKDGFAGQLSPEDFSEVVRVKLLGAWNLFSASQSYGLRFFVGLSSGASVQGNPGQVNYSAANRAMTALMVQLSEIRRSVVFKALQLPPVEGVGMAEDPEIRALMKRMNATYVHVNEIAELFVRELCFGAHQDVNVMFMRSLPSVPQVLLDPAASEEKAGELLAGTMSFVRNEFPMMDSVEELDLRDKKMQATRTFSHDKDLWLPDHKPYKFLKYPLVSAIMAVETMLEAARILCPHLNVKAVREAQFLDILECPPGKDRISEVSCRQISSPPGEIVCDATISTRDVSPTGRVLDKTSINYKASVVLGNGIGWSDPDPSRFPVRTGELDSRPMDHAEVLKWYEDRSDMQGRYRLMEAMDGSGPDCVRGRFVYRETNDFAPPLKTSYQYSPYLLEALMQAAIFFVIMRDESEERTIIPHGIGEVIPLRRCTNGETVIVEGRMVSRTDEGLTWEARAVDEKGNSLMILKKMVLRWFNA